MTTPAQRRAVDTHTRKLLESGGSRITLKLSPKATAALAKLTASGSSRTAIIERLILESV